MAGAGKPDLPLAVAASQLRCPHLDLDVGLEPTTQRLRGSCSAIELVEDTMNLRIIGALSQALSSRCLDKLVEEWDALPAPSRFTLVSQHYLAIPENTS